MLIVVTSLARESEATLFEVSIYSGYAAVKILKAQARYCLR